MANKNDLVQMISNFFIKKIKEDKVVEHMTQKFYDTHVQHRVDAIKGEKPVNVDAGVAPKESNEVRNAPSVGIGLCDGCEDRTEISWFAKGEYWCAKYGKKIDRNTTSCK